MARCRSRRTQKARNSPSSAEPSRSATHNCTGSSRPPHRSRTPPPSTRDTRSSTREKRSSRVWSAWASSSSHTSSREESPCHRMMFSVPKSSSSRATRAVRHASQVRCASRRMSEYFRRTSSLLAGWSGLKRASSVMKASTVCMPLTSDSFRSHRYSASRSQPGTVTTEGQKGSRTLLWSPCSFGSRTTMEPRHGSATTSTPSPLTTHPVHTRSTMQLTTPTRSASLRCSDSTAAWSFSQAKSSGCSLWSRFGSDESSGSSTLAIAPPSEQEKEVARASSSPRSLRLEPKTRLCGGIASGTPSRAATTSTFCTRTLLLTLTRSWSDREPCRKRCCHRALGRWTTAKGTPDAETAGTTSPRPSRPAPK
mmetsp:Transcript_11381/g.23138  ORF Transcript_11381/g.23138 Transcript_11381/m.23138 type:complete len:367 (-) Transcript_11381:209-1309(-)